MTLLERLKELNDGNEWDFNDLGFLVNALPDLIAVAEAAKMVLKVSADWDKVHPEDADYDTVLGDHIVSVSELDAALAKLEAAHED